MIYTQKGSLSPIRVPTSSVDMAEFAKHWLTLAPIADQEMARSPTKAGHQHWLTAMLEHSGVKLNTYQDRWLASRF